MSDDDGECSKYFLSNQTKCRLRLDSKFYDMPCEELAKCLLGKVLVRKFDDNTIVRGRIVETESYLGNDDAASFSFQGKLTTRNEPMFMKPGTVFVYMTYGMYHCFNISSKGDGSAVLLRAIEPLENLDAMVSLRTKFKKNSKTILNNKDLCNGPAKLCISFGIDIKSCNKQDLTDWDGMWIEEDEKSSLVNKIVCTPRIGIKCEKEWQEKFLRFYILDNKYVSKLEKTKMNIITYSQIKK